MPERAEKSILSMYISLNNKRHSSPTNIRAHALYRLEITKNDINYVMSILLV